MKRTAGVWDRNDRGEYFLVCLGVGDDAVKSVSGRANNIPDRILGDKPKATLFPYYDMPKEIRQDEHGRILMDSGAFTLCNTASKETGVPLGQIFGMAIEDIPNGPSTLAAYEEKVKEVNGQVWGYIEFDIGNYEAKTVRREDQWGRGIRPIPVFSVMNDPIDYFQYLLNNYDRVAIGSIARGLTRKNKARVLAACERIYRESGSNAWVHLLGCSPSPSTAWASSMDSSNWATLGIFGGEVFECHVAGGRIKLDPCFSENPRLSSDMEGREAAIEQRHRVHEACATRDIVVAFHHFQHRREVEQAINPNNP